MFTNFSFHCESGWDFPSIRNLRPEKGATRPAPRHGHYLTIGLRKTRRTTPLTQNVSGLFEYLMAVKYTAKQGQYLAFIYYYTKIHGRTPAESDLQDYFRVSPPSVHQMILHLEKEGFIERVPGQGRSIRLLLGRDQLPDLE